MFEQVVTGVQALDDLAGVAGAKPSRRAEICEWVRLDEATLRRKVRDYSKGTRRKLCALAHAAIRHGHSALYLRAPRMLDDLAIARADGRLTRLLASWARVDLLLIDDLVLRPLTPDQAADLLEVIEDRAQLRSTIVTSQLPVAHWHEALGEATVADAILDRLLQNAHRIELSGESLRRPETATMVSAGAATSPEKGAHQVSEAKSGVAPKAEPLRQP